jgi:hypothetical protein
MKLLSKAAIRPALVALFTAAMLISGSTLPAVAGHVETAGYVAQVHGERLEVAAVLKRKVRFYGQSKYICIPSGFGQMGRCYLRSAIAGA